MFDRPSTIPIRVVRSPGFSVTYSNNAQIGTTFYDIRIHFNDVVSSSDKEFVIEERSVVIMSPEHARDLSLALSEVLKRYEEKFGALRTVKQA